MKKWNPIVYLIFKIHNENKEYQFMYKNHIVKIT